MFSISYWGGRFFTVFMLLKNNGERGEKGTLVLFPSQLHKESEIRNNNRGI